jgi:CubicO group peptidase (beta-lactamase class C family)
MPALYATIITIHLTWSAAAVTVLTRALLAVLVAFAPVTARAEEWQTTSPEAQGMSSQELTKLVDFGIGNGMDSVLVTHHGHIVAEAYYAPFAAATKHRINSATKSVIGSLVAIALDEGLIKSLDQPAASLSGRSASRRSGSANWKLKSARLQARFRACC